MSKHKPVNAPLIIVEGEKKAIAACKAGLPTFALRGVASYKVKTTDPASDE